MKKVLLLLLFSMALLAKGQTSVYHPFPDSDAVWNVTYNETNPSFSTSYSYVLSADTVIAGNIYHKLFISCISCSIAGYNGAIRQSIIDKKVYFVYKDSSSEELLYNFNLNVGDTGYTMWGYPYTINGIDSVVIGNNYRKRWNLSSPSSGQNYAWGGIIIEGIGYRDLTGSVWCYTDYNHGNPRDYCHVLDCFKQNGFTLYPDTTTTCNIISSVNNLSEKIISITLSPNPFHTTATLNIYDLRFMNYDFKIYDVTGRLIKRQIINNKSSIINREGLADGIYFYQVRSKNYELMGSGKFVVE